MDRQRIEPAYALGTVFTASMVLAAVLGNERVPAVVATVVFGGSVVPVALRSRGRVAVAGAVIAWSMLTGFAVNRLGALSFHPGDLTRLGALAVVALAASALGGSAPDRRPPRRLGRVDPPYPVQATVPAVPGARTR